MKNQAPEKITPAEKAEALVAMVVYAADVLMHPNAQTLMTDRDRASLAAGAVRRAKKIAEIRGAA